jgi:hypothetical protein
MPPEQPKSVAAAAGAAQQRQAPTATIRFTDRPELAEIFADSVTGTSYDGQTLRLEFAVTRLDDIKSGEPITGRRYPACRVVLSPAGVLDLINRIQQIATALAQAGALKTTPRPGEPAKTA